MPVDKKRVSVYSGTDTGYEQRMSQGTIDENGIYFIFGETNNKIYVGSTLFGGGGSENQNITSFKHVIFHRVGALLYGEEPVLQYDLLDCSTTKYQTGIISGIYLNGLRSVSELNVTLDIAQSDEIRYPSLIISPNHDYQDSSTELTVDMYIFESETSLESPETITIETSDTNI